MLGIARLRARARNDRDSARHAGLDHEGQDPLETDFKKQPFGGYSPTIRTFWIKARDLVVSRRWDRRPPMEEFVGDIFSTLITGKAVSEKDSVCVIGKDRETREFALTIKSDAFAKQHWDTIRRLSGLETKNDGTTPALQWRARVLERFSKNPPTATMFVYEDDWELGYKGGWSIECAVPSSVLTQLEAELLAQRAHEVYVGIDWATGLVWDSHAPPSEPASWGLVTINEREGPEPYNGHVEVIGWRVSGSSVAGAG